MEKSRTEILDLCDQIAPELLEMGGMALNAGSGPPIQIHIDPYKLVMEQLATDGYIVPDPFDKRVYRFTAEGRKFVKMGGYKGLFEREKELSDLQNEKLKYDVRNAKRVYKTYPTTRLFAWIAFISTIILLLLKLAEVLKLWPYQQ